MARALGAGRQPLVLLPSDNQRVGAHAVHLVWRQYAQAVRLAGAVPLIAPPCSDVEMHTLLASVDGVLLTGSPSNVHPSHFGEDVPDPSLPLDPERDDEPLAPDGLVEAFSLEHAPGFNLCLQWHPEWAAADNLVSMQILRAFGAAVRAWQHRHQNRQAVAKH